MRIFIKENWFKLSVLVILILACVFVVYYFTFWSANKGQGVTKSQNSPNDSCAIKGNINASGEKIYHLPGCGSYSKTQIDESNGEKWFCNEAEARAAGWRKAGNCR